MDYQGDVVCVGGFASGWKERGDLVQELFRSCARPRSIMCLGVFDVQLGMPPHGAHLRDALGQDSTVGGDRRRET